MNVHDMADKTDDRHTLNLVEEAREMFGEMRPSTEEERRAYSEMLQQLSRPLPMTDIFDDSLDSQEVPMGAIDFSNCNDNSNEDSHIGGRG